MKIDIEFCKRVERAEARGLRSALTHGIEAFPGRGLEVGEIAGAFACYAGPDSPFNQTVGLGIDASVADSDIEAIVDFYHARSERARIITAPIAGEDLARKLQRHGFKIDEYVNALAADLTQVSVERDPRIEVCTDKELWAEHSARAFSDGKEPTDPLRFISLMMATHANVSPLALMEDGQIVATACCASESDDIGGLFAASTAPEARGRGHQKAMIADRLARLVEGGAKIARAGAKPGSISERNFRRYGFSVLYTRTEWIIKPDR